MQICLSMYHLLFKQTKNCEKKVRELDLEKLKNCGNIPNEQIFIAFTYLFMDFI